MKHLFENIDSVLFDLDGTLVETNIDFDLMRHEMFSLAAQAGLRESDLPNLDILGIVRYIEEHLGNDRGREFKAQAFQVLEEIELRHAHDTQEIGFARELLEALRTRKVKIGVVTRNCRVASDVSIAATDLTPDLMLCREDVQQTKPHPEQLLTALSLLGALPERSVMVGDHRMDVIAGKAAGMRTVGIITPERAANFYDSAAPDAVANSLREILDAVIDSNS